MIKTRVHESHIFSTGIDTPTSIVIAVSVLAPDGDEGPSRASCELLVENKEISFVRNGVVYPMSELSITLESIPPSVRERLNRAGSPIAPGQDQAKRAIQGLLDGSLVISDDELVTSDFHKDMLNDDDFCRLIENSDHIAAGIIYDS